MNKKLLALLISIFIIAIANVSFANCSAQLDAEGKPTGNTICIDPQTKQETVYAIELGDSTSGAMEGCKPLASKIHEFSKCIMCPMYKTIFNTANELITKAFQALAIPLRNIMSIIFALIIAIKTISQVSSFTANNSASFIDDIFSQGFKFIIAFLFLTFPSEVFYWIFNPLLAAGIEMGGAFLNTVQGVTEGKPGPDISNDFFSADIFVKIETFSIKVQQELAFMQALGSSMMCISWHSEAKWVIIPDGSLLISGLVMYAFAVAISIAFGYYLIDGILQLCLVGILTPFSLAAYPFNFSQKWMITTWSAFLDTFFKFVFMGLIVSIIVEIMKFAVTGGQGGYDVILAAMNEDNADTLKSFFDITSVAFISMCVCSIFAAKMTNKATELAATMSGGSMITAGNIIGGLAMSAITNPAKKVAGRAMSKVKDKAKNQAKKFGQSVKSKLKPQADSKPNTKGNTNDNNSGSGGDDENS